MKYLNRLGKTISEEEWKILSRDPHYCTVDVARGVAYTVKACWLGIASDYEEPPRPFVLLAFNRDTDAEQKEVVSNEKMQWFSSEQELQTAFRRWKSACFEHGKVPAQDKHLKESA